MSRRAGLLLAAILSLCVCLGAEALTLPAPAGGAFSLADRGVVTDGDVHPTGSGLDGVGEADQEDAERTPDAQLTGILRIGSSRPSWHLGHGRLFPPERPPRLLHAI